MKFKKQQKGVGILEMLVAFLTVSFVVLKFLGYITWSWWWVLSPLWITVIIFILFIAVVHTIIDYKINKISKSLRKWK